MTDNVNVIEQFYGVYLLYCTNPKYLGRTYIGFTVDPNRRIKQHNKGKKAGGAWKTSNRGPWNMVMIIHGFPNDIAALRFEWAWQHPLRSRRLSHLPRKKSAEKVYDYCIRIVSEMLQVGPWNRLPLTVRWLDFKRVKDLTVAPPIHMPICYGPVTSKKLAKSDSLTETAAGSVADVFICETCSICNAVIENDKFLKCLTKDCGLVSHFVCLARKFLNDLSDYVPVEGSCPLCRETYLWGDIIRKYRGCYGNLNAANDCDGSESDFSD